MRRGVTLFFAIMLFPLLAGFTSRNRISLWERMCEACHDGTTVLNGKVVIDKEHLKEKYKTVDELVNAVTCQAPPCMNILKHDETLVRKVGIEIGLKDTKEK